MLNHYFRAERDGRIVSIGDITRNENGDKCNCFCAECGAPLTARLGHKDTNPKGHIAHFAHKSKSAECDAKKVNESSLHKLAKQILLEYKEIVLPPFEVIFSETKAFVNLSEANKQEISELSPELINKVLSKRNSERILFERIEAEVSKDIDKERRIDVVGISKCAEYYIEVTVTHRDEEKLNSIQLTEQGGYSPERRALQILEVLRLITDENHTLTQERLSELLHTYRAGKYQNDAPFESENTMRRAHPCG